MIEAAGYDPLRDLENPADSIFCSHGAGVSIPWDQVPEHMHLESTLDKERKREAAREEAKKGTTPGAGSRPGGAAKSVEAEQELEEIFIRTYGKIERKRPPESRTVLTPEEKKRRKKEENLREYLLVDGYNVIFAWEDLKDLAKDNIDGARNRLMDILCNYQGYRKMTLILVFDAYKVEGNVGEVMKYHNIHVIYTKEAETADQYIEKTVHRMGGRYDVTVATSDAAEQMIIWGQGARRLSARGLRREIREACQEIQENYLKTNPGAKHYLFENLGDDMAALMEEVRLGKKKL